MSRRFSRTTTPADTIMLDALAGVLAVGVVVAGIGHLLLHQPGWTPEQVLRGLVGHVALGSAVALAAAWRLGTRRFGLANHVTLLRAGLTCLAAGALGAGGGAPGISWPLVALGAAALCLDGLDGWLARRLQLSSRFGARFDVEVDAFLLLTLSLLVWQSGRAGFWVLAIGLMRYGFLLAGRLVPALRRPLPASRRRKVICVVQGAVLLICLLPPLSGALASWLAAAALLALAVSFALDTASLLRRNEVADRFSTELDQQRP